MTVTDTNDEYRTTENGRNPCFSVETLSSGGRGREFKSRHSDHILQILSGSQNSGQVVPMNHLWFWLWRRWFCRHEYGGIEWPSVQGVTLGWSGNPTPLWEETVECWKCGHRKISTYILPAGSPPNRTLQPDGSDQRPIHPQTKERYPMAHGADD